MLLLVFVLVCGVHLAGIHHDFHSDGLGVVDGLATILMAAVLALFLTSLNRRTSPGSSKAEPAPRAILQAPAVDASAFRMVVPLRC